MSVRLVVLDHGSGNLRSAERALARAGAEVTVTPDRDAALRADGLVVPGVGAYAHCIQGLRSIKGDEIIASRLAVGAPVLGICVGMQMLFTAGTEDDAEGTEGLGLFSGVVDKLDAPVLPHMGWNTVTVAPGSTLFRGVESEHFYFVHSYAVPPVVPNALVTTAAHGTVFAAAVESELLSGTQFHPEKSGDAGLTLLENWIRSL